ncbi:hypothetical protein HK405_005869, partial [Cladochytrium tenue]
SGDSGKSTILKQMKIVYGMDFSRQERLSYRPQLMSNVLDCARALAAAMNSLEIPFGFEPPDCAAADTDSSPAVWCERLAEAARASFRDPARQTDSSPAVKAAAKIAVSVDSTKLGETDPLPPDVVADIKTLWADSGVQYCATRGNDLMEHVDDIANASHLPTNDAILASRKATTQISETVLNIDGSVVRVYDVAGQRKYRPKWVPYFENCDGIFFVSALSSYDQRLEEDNTTNKMIDSLRLFGMICNHVLFKDKPIILFLNKVDLVPKKLVHSPLEKYFPDYTGGDSFAECSRYFEAAFRKECASDPARALIVHFTWATDTSQTKKVLQSVMGIVLESSLKANGLI